MADQRPKVVIVDDDEVLRKAIARLLTSHGFATEVFESAEAFLSCLTSLGAACLVLDIHLTGMSGLELRRRLNAMGSELPVVFITATDDDDIRSQAVKVGCVACLRKPFAADMLISAISQAIRPRLADKD
jgi:FixJ family two-component response regulator